MKPASNPATLARIAVVSHGPVALTGALLLLCAFAHAVPAQLAKPELQNARGSTVGAAVQQPIPPNRASGEPENPLLAHWTFDELSGTNCADAGGHGCDASLEHPAPGFSRARGIHGQTLNLRGAHVLRARLNLP